MARIKIPCAVTGDTDYLLVESLSEKPRTISINCVRAVARASDDNWVFNETDIRFDEERARALFNWLGVWLHGGNKP